MSTTPPQRLVHQSAADDTKLTATRLECGVCRQMGGLMRCRCAADHGLCSLCNWHYLMCRVHKRRISLRSGYNHADAQFDEDTAHVDECRCLHPKAVGSRAATSFVGVDGAGRACGKCQQVGGLMHCRCSVEHGACSLCNRHFLLCRVHKRRVPLRSGYDHASYQFEVDVAGVDKCRCTHPTAIMEPAGT